MLVVMRDTRHATLLAMLRKPTSSISLTPMPFFLAGAGSAPPLDLGRLRLSDVPVRTGELCDARSSVELAISKLILDADLSISTLRSRCSFSCR